jgi:hypothetical protein
VGDRAGARDLRRVAHRRRHDRSFRGARGADIIAAEEAYARGARIAVCLALPRDEFRHRSVELPGTDWGARFHRLLGASEVRELTEQGGPAPIGDEAFSRANDWMVELAASSIRSRTL